MRWSRVEPVLRATYKLLDETEFIEGAQVLGSMESPPDGEEAGRAFRALNDAGYIRATFVMATPLPIMIAATERGLQHFSGWPTESGAPEAFLALIDERIADESTTDDQRGRLRRLREAAADVGTGLLAEVITKLIEHQTGM